MLGEFYDLLKTTKEMQKHLFFYCAIIGVLVLNNYINI